VSPIPLNLPKSTAEELKIHLPQSSVAPSFTTPSKGLSATPGRTNSSKVNVLEAWKEQVKEYLVDSNENPELQDSDLKNSRSVHWAATPDGVGSKRKTFNISSDISSTPFSNLTNLSTPIKLASSSPFLPMKMPIASRIPKPNPSPFNSGLRGTPSNLSKPAQRIKTPKKIVAPAKRLRLD